jgi:hypothetical protein
MSEPVIVNVTPNIVSPFQAPPEKDQSWRRKKGPKLYPLYPVNTKYRVKRNKPCPCGSGKKAKNCCAARLAAMSNMTPEQRTSVIVSGIVRPKPASIPPAVQARFDAVK